MYCPECGKQIEVPQQPTKPKGAGKPLIAGLMAVALIAGWFLGRPSLNETATGTLSQGETTPSVPARQSASSPALKVENIDTKITETNDVWARFAWKMTVSNHEASPVNFGARLEWQDKDGFVIDDAEEYGLALEPNQTHTFTGDTLIQYPAASRVDKIEVKLGAP